MKISAYSNVTGIYPGDLTEEDDGFYEDEWDRRIPVFLEYNDYPFFDEKLYSAEWGPELFLFETSSTKTNKIYDVEWEVLESFLNELIQVTQNESPSDLRDYSELRQSSIYPLFSLIASDVKETIFDKKTCRNVFSGLNKIEQKVNLTLNKNEIDFFYEMRAVFKLGTDNGVVTFTDYY